MKRSCERGPSAAVYRRLAWRTRRVRGERGSALVEYAIVFTLFMTVLLAIADFGLYLYAVHFVSSAAREGARYAMVRGCTPTTPTCPTAAASSDVQTFVKNVPLGIDASQVTVTTTWSPNHKPGSVVSVQVTYTFNFVFLFAWVPKTPPTITSTSKIVISQ